MFFFIYNDYFVLKDMTNCSKMKVHKIEHILQRLDVYNRLSRYVGVRRGWYEIRKNRE
jgi:hypothetical protein